MTFQELRRKLKCIKFIDAYGDTFEFIPENTIRFGNSLANLVNYTIYEENEKFYLIHNNLFGNEDMNIEIACESPLEIRLTPRYSKTKIIQMAEMPSM